MKWMNAGICTLLCSTVSGIPAAAAVDSQKLAQEVQISRQDEKGLRVVFWMNREFWDASMASTVPSAEQRATVLKRLDGYEIVAVLETKASTMGVLLGTSRDELMKKVSLQTGTVTLKPLSDDQLSAEMQEFLKNMQPMMGAIMGQLGQNLHMLVFKGIDVAGRRLLDPLQPGSFKVLLGDEAFAFRLPLGSLLPTTYDAETGEQFPGNYLYSPYSGRKLQTAKP